MLQFGPDETEGGMFRKVEGWWAVVWQTVTIQRASFPLIFFFLPQLGPPHWPALSLPFSLF